MANKGRALRGVERPWKSSDCPDSYPEKGYPPEFVRLWNCVSQSFSFIKIDIRNRKSAPGTTSQFARESRESAAFQTPHLQWRTCSPNSLRPSFSPKT